MESHSHPILDTIYSLIYPDHSDFHDLEPYEHGNDEKLSDAPHQFEPATFSLPTFCNYCHGNFILMNDAVEFIWGFVQQGQQCSICNYCAHNKCLESAPKSCRPTTDSMHHHFVEGNIPLGSACVICNESFEMLEFNGLRCSR